MLRYTQGRKTLPSNWIQKSADIAIAARKASPRVLQRLLELSESDHGPTAVRACEIILNRAYGRAPMNVDITHRLEGRELEETARRILLKRAKEMQRVARDDPRDYPSQDVEMYVGKDELPWSRLLPAHVEEVK